ncbi:hypothetical protein ABT039_22755 [Streptomyces lasiicapitis]|uniref:hypothetical protein n=1 Tax=Streptomyces lasiicapitis TaxID=1923961 RepID=UPI0033323E7D
MAPEGLSDRAWAWMKMRHPRSEQFWLYYPSAADGGFQELKVCDRAGYDPAVLIWHTCHACRRGLIAKISIAVEWQRQGIGRRLIRRAMRGAEDYRWTTSAQSELAQQFFPVMARETGASFAARAGSCQHIRDGGQHLPKPRLEQTG